MIVCGFLPAPSAQRPPVFEGNCVRSFSRFSFCARRGSFPVFGGEGLFVRFRLGGDFGATAEFFTLVAIEGRRNLVAARTERGSRRGVDARKWLFRARAKCPYLAGAGPRFQTSGNRCITNFWTRRRTSCCEDGLLDAHYEDGPRDPCVIFGVAHAFGPTSSLSFRTWGLLGQL